MESTPNPVIVIVGQTASGKSALGMKLAQQYNGEILCADSRTIYRGLNIGTAKPSAQDRASVPHHGLDLINPDERYSAAAFQDCGRKVIKDVHSRKRLPIIVGGTGLYVDGLLYNFSFNKAAADRQPLPPNVLIIGLTIDKEQLHTRIVQRVDTMFESGLLEEAQNVINMYGGGAPGLLASGFRAVAQHLGGVIDEQETKQLIIREHKSLAKRQMTWFKRNPDIVWCASEQQADDNIRAFLQEFATIDI